MARKHLIWAAPLLVLLLGLGAGLLALPGFVAAPTHRQAIEALATRLTGRLVHINGKLSLSYWPRPTLTATDISLSGRNHEDIQARSLSFDIALLPLLRGQFDVRTLVLDAPDISIPWPLPGGIHDIAPPPFLAALHAQIQNGTIHFGNATLTGVEATLLTGSQGSARINGHGRLQGHTLQLTLAVGQTAARGGTKISAHTELDTLSATFNGTLDANSLLNGQLALHLPNGMDGHATITANGNSVNATDLNLTNGKATIQGTATLTLHKLAFSSDLTGHDLDFKQFSALPVLWPHELNTSLQLKATQVTLAGHYVPSLRAVLTSGPQGYSLTHLTLGLEGDANLAGELNVAQDGALTGRLSLNAPDVAALSKSLGLPVEADLHTARLQTSLSGTPSAPLFNNISGSLNQAHIDGHVRLAAQHVVFQLHFDQLALLPLANWLHQLMPGADGYTAEGELTAAHATLGPLKLSQLFIDATDNGTLNIRRITANLYNGIAGGGLVLTPDLNLTSAQFFVDLPSASPLAPLVPHEWHLPAAFFKPRLNLAAAFAGPANALAGSMVLKLGELTATTIAVINPATLAATGTLSLQAPDAIETLKTLGVVEGCSRMMPLPGYPFQGGEVPCLATADNPGLLFPGPGSLSLRGYFAIAPNNYQLNNFVFNAGLLNAAGQLAFADDTLKGRINAGVLALPALPPDFAMPDHLPLSAQLALSATQVLYNGQAVLGPSAGSLTLSPTQASLTLSQATLGKGTLSGQVSLALSSKAPPSLHAKFAAQGVNAHALSLPQSFPLRLSEGQINATADLTATGKTATAWGTSLGGSATLTAKNGVLDGVSLTDAGAALAKHQYALARRAMSRGTTSFTTLSLSSTLAQGNGTLTHATLSAPSGTLTAVGEIHLFDPKLALTLTAHPTALPSATLTTKLRGTWAAPERVTQSQIAAPPAHAKPHK